MKNKIVDVVFKKFQSYSFIIFLALIIAAFIIIVQLNRKDDQLPVDKTQQTTETPQNQEDPLENEIFQLPIDAESPVVARDIWDVNSSFEEQVNAIIQVDQTFYLNNGVNYTIDKETEFNVLASLSGTVKEVRQDVLLGYLVEIEHLYGIRTYYHSLDSVSVAVGDKVDQGDVIGIAGSNNFDKDSGVHVHFEVLKDNTRLNPNELIGTKISEFKTE